MIEDNGNISDGYHTFNELYEHRNLLFLSWIAVLPKYRTWKSTLHSDGTMYDGWFIAGVDRLAGEQISYHLPIRLWDSCTADELHYAPKFDGHTPNDVLDRMRLGLTLL